MDVLPTLNDRVAAAIARLVDCMRVSFNYDDLAAVFCRNDESLPLDGLTLAYMRQRVFLMVAGYTDLQLAAIAHCAHELSLCRPGYADQMIRDCCVFLLRERHNG